MDARAHSPAHDSPGCYSSCDRGRVLYHPQRKESHGKAFPQAHTKAKPVQEEALLTSDIIASVDGIDWANWHRSTVPSFVKRYGK